MDFGRYGQTVALPKRNLHRSSCLAGTWSLPASVSFSVLASQAHTGKEQQGSASSVREAAVDAELTGTRGPSIAPTGFPHLLALLSVGSMY